MKQKTKFTIAMVAGMAAAFAAGLFIETPKTTGLPYADVSRAKTFTKSVVEVDVDVLQEQLLADTTYFKTLMANAILMQYQAHTLAEAIEKTNELVGDNPAFAESVQTMNVGKQSIDNACSNLDLYVSSLNSLKEKKKVKQFEQIYNNALLSYYLVSNKTGYAELFEKDAKAYFEAKEIANVEEIKGIRFTFSAYVVCNEMMLLGAIPVWFYGQESLNMVDFLDQEKLNLMGNQDLLKIVGQEENLKLYPDQEQLKVGILNQEQLGIWEQTNNKKLQVVNEEKLQISEKEELQTLSEEKLNMP